MSGFIACYSTCWACKFDEHLAEWHTWADSEDIEHARATGQNDPSTQQCGCHCQRRISPPPEELGMQASHTDDETEAVA